jgi:hypothetical protein
MFIEENLNASFGVVAGNGASINGKIGNSATNPVNCNSYGRFGNGANVTSIKLISTQINWSRGEATVYAVPY